MAKAEVIGEEEIRMGRPRHPENERLVAHGLRLAPDKKRKLVEIKDFEGVSIRDWVERHIESDWTEVQRKKAQLRADRKAARESGRK